MNTIHKDLEVKDFTQSGEFEEVKVCSVSGLLPSGLCSADVRGSKVIKGYFHKDDVPTEKCDVHIAYEICEASGCKAGEFCPVKKEVAVQSIERYAPVAGVVLSDEKYTVRPKDATRPDNMFFYAVKKGDVRINDECTLHTSAPPVENQAPVEGEGTVTESQTEDQETAEATVIE